ncbi:MFS transporter [Candidatus Bathyarchaeota archaeon]|nr:MAG: MFS transporter [Candidatus Bathyarchaeota archaeon]
MGERGYLRVVALLTVASFVINLGFSALSPIFPYLILAVKGILRELPELTSGAVEAHQGAVELGMLSAAFMAMRAPTAGVVGFVSDAIGKKKTILLGMGLYTASYLGFIFSNNLQLFILFRGVQGVASGMVWPVAEALLSDVTPRWSRGKMISVYSSSMMVAQVVGPGIGVGVYKLYVFSHGGGDVILALKIPLLLLVLLSLISLLTLLLLPSHRGGTDVRRSGFREVFKMLGEMPGYVLRSLRVIYVNGFINGLAMGILQTVAIVYMIEKVAKDPFFIGLFFSIFSIVALPATFLAGYLSDRWRRRKPFVVFGYVVGRFAFFLIPLVTSYTLLLVLGAMLSLVFAFSSPAMRALQADLAADGVRGSIFGLQQLFFNSGTFVGALLGGYITKVFAEKMVNLLGYLLTGYIVPFWMAGSLGILTTVLFVLYVEERRGSPS